MILHIVFTILYLVVGIVGIKEYRKAPPTSGHAVVLFVICIYIALTFFYFDIYLTIQRIQSH